MNGAHYHLIVNHLPIVGAIIGTLILIAGFLLKKDQIKQTGLGVYVFSSITAVVAFLTGEGAEEVVEDLPQIGHDIIHTHEELGETFLIVSIVLGVLSIITFILNHKKHTLTKFSYYLVFIIGVMTVILGKSVGTSGGEIRHTEIRNEGSTINTPTKDKQDKEANDD